MRDVLIVLSFICATSGLALAVWDIVERKNEMKLMYPLRDAQEAEAFTYCRICGGEVYNEDDYLCYTCKEREEEA